MSPVPGPPRSRRSTASAAAHAPAPPTGLPLAHPAMLAAAAVTALCLLVSVSFRIDDPDLWQHLAVGRALWAGHAIPRSNVWTWPTYGDPYVLPSWGFRALLWPVWAAAGERGLFAWRWITTLAAFGLLLAAARRMGARGFATFLVMALCALVYRKRTEMRPETLVSILLALEIWILESRRGGGADRSAWLVPLACVWANLHISWPIGFAVLGFHALGDLLRPRPGAPRARLVWVGLAAAAASLVNPFGWRLLWQPFEFLLHERNEPIYRGIAELQPVEWSRNLLNGLPLLVLAWPLLALGRARRQGIDWAEALMIVFFLGIGLSSQRFIGFLALACAPYLARDLAAALAPVPRKEPRDARPPAWTAAPAARAALVAVACVAGSLPDWLNSRTTFGTRIDLSQTPVAACDFMARHDVRGQGFNPFHFGGYLLWRFWPDPGRLPFMDIHQTGTPLDRTLATGALVNRQVYGRLMARHAFDYALIDRQTPAQHPMLGFFDSDPAWALVFVDDAAALFVRRAGHYAALADSLGFRVWPAGYSGLGAVYSRYRADSAYRAQVDRELARQIADSPYTALAHDSRANLALLLNRVDEAEAELRAALAVTPRVIKAHERLGLIALWKDRPREALREFDLERRDDPGSARLEMPIAEAWRELGDRRRAADWYRRELRHHPDNQVARDSLAAMER